MSRRILGQCNYVDILSIEHLALEKPEDIDTYTLTNRMQYGYRFLASVLKRKIPLKMLKLVKEVLFWGTDDGVTAIEIKFVRDLKNADDIEKFNELWNAVL